MDLKDTVQPQDNAQEAHIKTSPVIEEQEKVFKLCKEEANDIIRDYILNGIIEKTYKTSLGISITFRAPNQGQLMQALTATDEEAFEEDARMSMDRMQLIRNNNILAIYTKKYGKHDYASEQGEKYYTEDGFKERRAHLLSGSTMNVFAMDWAIKRLNEFQKTVTAAFDDENLKNM